tara:strand:+ start:592 stop:1248 length:657 start_codon:yes stop_codon:yes gene_type:complete
MLSLNNQRKFNEFIKRAFYGTAYATTFLYCILNQSNTSFYLLILLFLIGTIYEFVKLTKILKSHYIKILLFLYILSSFYLLLHIKLSHAGSIKIIILIAHVWAVDLGGYIIGNIFGSTKISKISPNKTLEGIIGSFIFSILITYIINNTWNLIQMHFIIFTISICSSAIFGDLIFSKIKRINKTKDSGVFLPGHGGFLDRLDSLIMATPVFYLYLQFY